MMVDNKVLRWTPLRGNFLKIKKIKNLVEKQINDGVIGKDDGECQG
jgi:hypothetical protein